MNELKRLQKVDLVVKNLKTAELLQFMFESLGYFKKYFPMIKILRTRGLAMRHWRQISAALGITVEPASTCVFRLIAMGFHLDEKFRICKGISEIAQKEYAVQ